jgi:hypothetical protein
MGLVGTLSNRRTQERLRRVTERVTQDRRTAPASGSASHPPRRKRRRCGSIQEAIATVLANYPEGLRARDIHVSVEALLGGPVAASSIKDCLSRNAADATARIERVTRGRYGLRDPAE